MKFSSTLFAAAALLTATLISAAPAPQTSSSAKPLPHRTKEVDDSVCDAGSKQLTGEIQVSDERSLFFWYAESRRDPSKDPLLLWLQGGPGSASLFGMFTENGPCLAKPDGSGTERNPHSWTEFANVIYIDQPAGVGFSKNTGAQPVSTLETASTDLSNFLQTFVTSIKPEMAKRPIVVTGESFAGHYIPHFFAHYDQGAKNGAYVPLNLAGAGLGNAVFDLGESNAGWAELACTADPQGTGLEGTALSQDVCQQITPLAQQCKAQAKACRDSSPENGGDWSSCDNLQPLQPQPGQDYSCAELFSSVPGAATYPYDIRYPKCDFLGQQGRGPREEECPIGPLRAEGLKAYLNQSTILQKLDMPNAQCKDLNIDIRMAFGNSPTRDFVRPTVAELQYMLDSMPNTRVLIFNGNADPMINTPGQVAVLEEVINWSGREEYVRNKMKTWKFDKLANDGKAYPQVGGKSKGTYKLQFTTINAAGHMVPSDQPEAALYMMKYWVDSMKK